MAIRRRSKVEQAKIILLGDAFVGKTSILRRYTDDSFISNGNSRSTSMGVDFRTKTVIHEDRPLLLKLWDTAGQERFRSIVRNYLRDLRAAIIIYDITEGSITQCHRWLQDVREENPNAVVMIVGNKLDLEKQRKIATDYAEQIAIQDLHAMFIETSAKTGENVEELFHRVVSALFQSEKKLPPLREAENSDTCVDLQTPEQKDSEQKRCPACRE